MLNLDLKDIPCFGVAGNFTGHLEQAGEAKDFLNVKTKDSLAPKALFPTYIPEKNAIYSAQDLEKVPDYLKIFPFSADKIIFPPGQANLQAESECAIIADLDWQEVDGKKTAVSLKPFAFGASNDCSIRKEGAKKISEKKNWGVCSKGLSKNLIDLTSFDLNSNLNDYRIASFLVRDREIFDYGEDSAVFDYTYIYEKLSCWILECINKQKNEGPAEKIYDYLVQTGFPKKIMISIGATRYTDFGEHNYLQDKDISHIVLYPQSRFCHEDIKNMILKENFTCKEISFLSQIMKI